MRVQWAVLALSIILLMGPITVGPISFADDDENLTLLQEKCAKVPKDPAKIKPECELLNIINELEQRLDDKDAELMAKDMELMTASGNLGSDLAAVQADADTSCATIPVVKTGFGLVTGSTVIALDTFNVGIDVFNLALGLFNDALMDALVAFNVRLGQFNVALGLFNGVVDNFNSALDTTIKALNKILGVVLGILNLLDPFDVIPDPSFATFGLLPNIPDIPDIPTIPVVGMLEIPPLATIDTSLIGAADDAVQSLALCT